MSHNEALSSQSLLDVEKSTPSERFVDYDEVLERVGGCLDTLQKLTEMFLSTATDYLQKIDQAIDQGDCENISNFAHALKGQVAFFTSERPHSAIVRIEHSAREENQADAGLAFADLNECWPNFIGELNHVIDNIQTTLT
jgi:HPt (histidine-containing phosphotransfer) domain-containing protein